MAERPALTAVIGLGYIGLPTAAILADSGVEVVGVDVQADLVDSVNRAELPFAEPDLDAVLRSAVASGRLRATTDIPAAEVYVIAVPTPFRADRTADLSHVETVARGIAAQLHGGELVILESTSPPGTTELVAQWVLEERPDLAAAGVQFAHCPERVLPGRMMVELVENDRIIGGLTPAAAQRAVDLYATFCKGQLVTTDARTAELAKLVENSYRDVNIAFANELSLICDAVGVDVWELIRLANHHPRVDILSPGPGVGGHCIAVDPWFIVAAAPEQARLIRCAREVNDGKPHYVVDRVAAAVPGDAVVAVLGLAFKKNVDDLRESPAVEVTHRLAQRLPAARLLVVEPHVRELPASLAALDNVALSPLEAALAGAQAVLLLVDHDEFARLTLAELAGKQLFDTRGLFTPR